MKDKPYTIDFKYNPDFQIQKVNNPSAKSYLTLYKEVGEKWSWYNRLHIPKEELLKIIHHDLVEIYILYEKKKKVGFAEIDRRIKDEIELIYFGLLPGKTGKGIGASFLFQIIDVAFSYNPKRFWLHTCEMDHPAALEFYLKAGFSIYKENIEKQEVPENCPDH